ncbi:ATP phosphoribosyltransferase regulatory subunit [Halomonadaceae bacterium KBTZ08]
MSTSDRWLLPDGVADVLPPRAHRVEALRRELIDTYRRWGFELIIPPMIEYLQSLLTGTGNDLDLQTFKLTDQLTGRMMGVRADMTPQAARMDAHSLRREGVTRLCYAGHVLHARPSSMLANRTPLQVGCELFGSRSSAADQEIIDLMLETLTAAGVETVHLDMAHVGIFQCLAEQAALGADLEQRVFDALRRCAIPELDELLGSAEAGSARAMLRDLGRLTGGEEVPEAARQRLANAPAPVLEAINQLEQTAQRVRERHPDVAVGFDFSELRGYNYHTGLVFAAYTPGQEEALAQGGRYDAVGEDFGRARPATGFSADLNRLLDAGRRSCVSGAGAIVAPAGSDAALRQRISELRQSETVIQQLDDEASDRVPSGCDRQLVWRDGDWQVVPL